MEKNSYYNKAGQIKNKVISKDSEILFLSSKLSSIQKENTDLKKIPFFNKNNWL